MLIAKVAELVDAHDSKSCILGCAGSIPAFGTSIISYKAFNTPEGFFILQRPLTYREQTCNGIEPEKFAEADARLTDMAFLSFIKYFIK